MSTKARREAVVRAAAEYLEFQEHDPGVFLVKIDLGDGVPPYQFRGAFGNAPGETPAMPVPPGHRPLSALEADILSFLQRSGGQAKTDEIAAAIGVSPRGDLPAVLRNLASVGWVELTQGHGVRLIHGGASAAERVP